MVPPWVLEATWGGPKSAQAAFGLLEASWRALGDLLDQKNTLDRRLAALRRIPRQFAAIIGANRVPKWPPGGGSKRGPKLSLAENAEIIKTLTQYTGFQ